MNCCSTEQCYEVSFSQGRNFFTSEEKIEMLSEYKQRLLNEAKGVEERIAQIKAHKEKKDED